MASTVKSLPSGFPFRNHFYSVAGNVAQDGLTLSERARRIKIALDDIAVAAADKMTSEEFKILIEDIGLTQVLDAAFPEGSDRNFDFQRNVLEHIEELKSEFPLRAPS
jgi:hypothetical protein